MKSEREQYGTGTGTGTGKGTTAMAGNSRSMSQLLLANLWLLLIPFWHAIWPPIKCGHFAFSSVSLSLSLYVCVFLFCTFHAMHRFCHLLPPTLSELNWAEVSICCCSCRARFVAELNRFAVPRGKQHLRDGIR